MKNTDRTGYDQAALWNGPAGHAWVEEQALLDRILKPFEELLLEAALTATPHAALDVGCGCGSTTLSLALRLGENGSCTGIDISAPMIGEARQRAEREGVPACFILADAEHHTFEAARFDLIMSRFGVMFFEDPVAAFTNLRRATLDGGRLCFITWRGAEENPFMTAAERAAAPLLPNLPARRPNLPGQFALADRGRTARILEESGWGEI